uniref:Uncharacterized protein n=1 Tax=Arundo donax TaxID=35708 RepID=A0A0A9FP62_ARUDO
MKTICVHLYKRDISKIKIYQILQIYIQNQSRKCRIPVSSAKWMHGMLASYLFLS